jgi:hypothetical protein
MHREHADAGRRGCTRGREGKVPTKSKVKAQARAQELRALVDEALAEARKRSGEERDRMGAVNWADLRCVDVEQRTSLIKDSTTIAVTIEEAAPDAIGLQTFVGEYLERKGWPHVRVATER